MNQASDKRALLLIELNEVNIELLEQAARTLPLRNLRKITDYSRVRTRTEDQYDSGFLEPWVQWVSVHTGQPSTCHRIKHLGDVGNLRHTQVWEKLSQQNVNSAIWGVMNANRGDAPNCRLFLCDPWTFGEPPYPKQLAGLTNFAQYIAKNYLNLSPVRMLTYSFEYLSALLKYVGFIKLIKATMLLLEGVLRFGPRNLVLGAFFEYTASIAFLNERKKLSPMFSIVFFNILAHIQHHYWTSTDKVSPQLAYGFKVFDAMLEEVFAQSSNEVILIANALSQINTNAEEPWILYRPKDHGALFKALGLQFEKVEALMTYDGHLFFSNPEHANRAFELISQAKVGENALFYVERDQFSPCKIFYRLEFARDTTPDTTFQFDDKNYPFLQHFERVVQRTGKHCQDGFVLQNDKIMPDKILNHEIHDYICRFFGVNVAETQARPAETLVGS